ncbi:PREDICTED: uncharacterized protein LOC104815030 [Tarenaya hassleriana]|uniref:uncharacterized protein LOC104815030 n=1 Tax=Tarenaya hassleriana TaxID=28532 RepID=UPI00053C1603|nr:PREDICTED: uncharacterized protein LOC104815030 [Tarenaya hassleriana]
MVFMGHSAQRCPQFRLISASRILGGSPQSSPFPPYSPRSWQPRVNHTIMQQYDASPWLVDSGASHHITSDLESLSLHSPYRGGDEVILGDGSSLPITHTGEGSKHGGGSSQGKA